MTSLALNNLALAFEQTHNKRPMGHSLLYWEKQLLHIYKCQCTILSAILSVLPLPGAIRTPIWPFHKKVKGHPSLIIWTNLADLESPMLYSKIQPQSFLSSGESVFTIYGHGSQLVQWCRTIWTICQYRFNRRPHVKSGESWSSDSREKDI